MVIRSSSNYFAKLLVSTLYRLLLEKEILFLAKNDENGLIDDMTGIDKTSTITTCWKFMRPHWKGIVARLLQIVSHFSFVEFFITIRWRCGTLHLFLRGRSPTRNSFSFVCWKWRFSLLIKYYHNTDDTCYTLFLLNMGIMHKTRFS